jgi:hypothetical protein
MPKKMPNVKKLTGWKLKDYQIKRNEAELKALTRDRMRLQATKDRNAAQMKKEEDKMKRRQSFIKEDLARRRKAFLALGSPSMPQKMANRRQAFLAQGSPAMMVPQPKSTIIAKYQEGGPIAYKPRKPKPKQGGKPPKFPIKQKGAYYADAPAPLPARKDMTLEERALAHSRTKPVQYLSVSMKTKGQLYTKAQQIKKKYKLRDPISTYSKDRLFKFVFKEGQGREVGFGHVAAYENMEASEKWSKWWASKKK